jgi:hypothetical protein
MGWFFAFCNSHIASEYFRKFDSFWLCENIQNQRAARTGLLKIIRIKEQPIPGISKTVVNDKVQ